jgi:hypothetical protein
VRAGRLAARWSIMVGSDRAAAAGLGSHQITRSQTGEGTCRSGRWSPAVSSARRRDPGRGRQSGGGSGQAALRGKLRGRPALRHPMIQRGKVTAASRRRARGMARYELPDVPEGVLQDRGADRVSPIYAQSHADDYGVPAGLKGYPGLAIPPAGTAWRPRLASPSVGLGLK